MMELEDYGIAFAAVDARVLSEVLPHAQLILIRGLIPRMNFSTRADARG